MKVCVEPFTKYRTVGYPNVINLQINVRKYLRAKGKRSAKKSSYGRNKTKKRYCEARAFVQHLALHCVRADTQRAQQRLMQKKTVSTQMTKRIANRAIAMQIVLSKIPLSQKNGLHSFPIGNWESIDYHFQRRQGRRGPHISFCHGVQRAQHCSSHSTHAYRWDQYRSQPLSMETKGTRFASMMRHQSNCVSLVLKDNFIRVKVRLRSLANSLHQLHAHHLSYALIFRRI